MAIERARTVACFGECMIELRAAGPRLLRQGYAGDTCNAAIYLSRLKPAGVTVCYAMSVGGDSFAQPMREAWREEGLSDRLVRVVPERSTGLYAIDVDERGERHFSYWRDASAARAYFDAPTTPLEEAADEVDVLMLSGISVAILPEPGRERLWALIGRLRSRGAAVVWDNNYRPRLWRSVDEARTTMARFRDAGDIALLTLDDERAFGGAVDRAALQALPCGELVVKQGAQPTLVRRAGEPFDEVPVGQVERPIDTTAAGDAFAGAYVAARLRGRAPREAAAIGNRVAGTVVQHPGAIIPLDAMPQDLWA